MMSAKKSLPKPRNPYLIQMVARKQGAQVKSKKASRSRDKAKLKSGGYDG